MAESQESEQPDQASLQELTTDSPPELKSKVNTFLNGLGSPKRNNWHKGKDVCNNFKQRTSWGC